MKKRLIIVVLITATVTCLAQEAESILEESREKTRVESFQALSTLIITDKSGNQRTRVNTIVSRNFPDGTEKRLITFNSPPEVQGTTILVFDHAGRSDEMWIYLPALRKSRRVVSSERGRSFMGSEFSNADISWPSNADFTSKFLENGGDPQFIYIESIPVNVMVEKEYGYSRRISKLNRESLLIASIDFYDSSNRIFKKIEIPSYKEISASGKFMITGMKVYNLSNNRSSEMIMTDIEAPHTRRSDVFDPLLLGR